MGRLQWLTVVLCGLVMFLDGFDTQTIGYMAPYIAKEWHLTKAMLGPILSAAQVGLVIGYVGLAPLSDRFGHKRVVAGGTLAFALSTLSCLLARDVTSLTPQRSVSMRSQSSGSLRGWRTRVRRSSLKSTSRMVSPVTVPRQWRRPLAQARTAHLR
jgi:MFS family permease